MNKANGNRLPPGEVEKMARLARLALGADEARRIARDLEAILALVARLDEMDLDGVAPLAHPAADAQRLRADEPAASDRRDALQAGAPAVAEGFYLVPKVIE